jgi:hypothetical protein
MSDGPYKSLPMQPHWRNFANQAAKPAFGRGDLCCSMSTALSRDLRGGLVVSLRETLTAASGSLFGTDKRELSLRVEALRFQCAGSVAGTALVDNTLIGIARGVPQAELLTYAVRAAAQDRAESSMRGIEEHTLRAQIGIGRDFIHDRLSQAYGGCDWDQVTQMVLGPAAASRSTRQRGVDQGPSI